MRNVHALAGIATGGLVAASLVLGAPASARDVVNGTGGADHLRGTPFSDTIRGFGGGDRVHALAGADLIGDGSGATWSTRNAVTTPSAAAPNVTFSAAVKVTTPSTAAPDGTLGGPRGSRPAAPPAPM